jgi:hypothetical protein
MGRVPVRPLVFHWQKSLGGKSKSVNETEK